MREKEREFCACRLYVCNHFSRTFYETSMKRWLQKTIILSRPNKHEQPVLFFFTSLSLSYCPLFLFGMSLFLLGMSLFLLGMSDMSLSLSLLDTSFFHSFS